MAVSVGSLPLERALAAVFTCAPTGSVRGWHAAPGREVLIALGQLCAEHLCQNSCAGQELKELNSLIATASRKPLCKNDYKSRIPFLVALFTLWCILYTSTKCTSAAITKSRTVTLCCNRHPESL